MNRDDLSAHLIIEAARLGVITEYGAVSLMARWAEGEDLSEHLLDPVRLDRKRRAEIAQLHRENDVRQAKLWSEAIEVLESIPKLRKAQKEVIRQVITAIRDRYPLQEETTTS